MGGQEGIEREIAFSAAPTHVTVSQPRVCERKLMCSNTDALDPARMARLGQATDDFRSRQRRDFEEREVEKTEYKARDQLIKLDEEKGVKARIAAAVRDVSLG